MDQNNKDSSKRLKEIQDEFLNLGITQDLYPKCEDMHVFGQRFKKCSILKNVPTRLTDTSDPYYRG